MWLVLLTQMRLSEFHACELSPPSLQTGTAHLQKGAPLCLLLADRDGFVLVLREGNVSENHPKQQFMCFQLFVLFIQFRRCKSWMKFLHVSRICCDTKSFEDTRRTHSPRTTCLSCSTFRLTSESCSCTKVRLLILVTCKGQSLISVLFSFAFGNWISNLPSKQSKATELK